jgi:hypothetical protein
LNHADRKSRLEALLLDFQAIWRPQPFKTETPEWCGEHPELTGELLALDDGSVERLGADNRALIGWLSRHISGLTALDALIDLPAAPAAEVACSEANSRLFLDIPGRKQAQIQAYATAIGPPAAPVLEWCAGKGHLGRLLAHRWQRPVLSLEIDAGLCDAGTELASQARVKTLQRFTPTDVLDHASHRHLNSRHAVALHACGDLHTRLITAAVAQRSPALNLAPCCYYRTAVETYVPLSGGKLVLSRDDRRLAVTETATASPRLQRQSRQALAWKLGWLELRKRLTGEDAYRTFPPVPETWLRSDFATFATWMAERAGICAALTKPELQQQLAEIEAIGRARAARMLRLQLPRLGFRRALEVWLVMDMAVYLEQNGYRVEVTTFCPRELTPRNLLLSARRM